MRSCYPPTRKDKNFLADYIKYVGMDTEQLDLSHVAGGNAKWRSYQNGSAVT